MRPAQRWEITANLAFQTDDGNYINALLVEIGFSGTGLLTMPQNVGSFRKIKATSASASASNGSDTASFSANGLIPAGTYFQWGAGSKVYMVLNDVTNGSAKIHPRCRGGGSGSIRFRDNVHMRFMLDMDVARGTSYVDGILQSIEGITFIEAL